MKRFNANLLVVAAVLFLAGGSVVFAEGQSEAPAPQGPGNVKVTVASETTTVTGQLHFINLIHPVIKNGTTEYELLVPRYDVYQAGIKDGQTITVEGYKVDGDIGGPFYGRNQSVDQTPKLLVTSATVDGKTYDLQAWADRFKVALDYRGERGPMMGYGPAGRGDFGPGSGGWRHPGYGPGYGPSYGPGFGPQFGPGMGY